MNLSEPVDVGAKDEDIFVLIINSYEKACPTSKIT